jgi:hypothetical protein
MMVNEQQWHDIHANVGGEPMLIRKHTIGESLVYIVVSKRFVTINVNCNHGFFVATADRLIESQVSNLVDAFPSNEIGVAKFWFVSEFDQAVATFDDSQTPPPRRSWFAMSLSFIRWAFLRRSRGIDYGRRRHM